MLTNNLNIQSGNRVMANNSDYQQLLDANPYRNPDYRESPWQKFLKFLGFRTQADAYAENMQIQANEYDAQIAQKQYDEQYNDPLNQVARMRNAGLNPDIDGGSSIDSGSAQNLGEDPSTPMQSTGEEQQLMDFANGLMNIFSTAIGLTSGVQGIARNRIQNNLLRLQTDNDMTAFAKQMFPYFLPDSDAPNILDDGTALSWQAIAKQNASIFAGSLNKKNQKSFMNKIQSFWNGALGKAESYEDMQKLLQTKFGYDVAKGTYGDPESDLFGIFAEELANLNKQIIKESKNADLATAKGATAEGNYNAEYFNSLDGSTIAKAENAQAEFNALNIDMNKILNESLDRLIQKIDERAKEGGLGGGLSNIALSLIGIFRLMITTQGLPSMSRSSSSNIKWGSDFKSERSSMSIGW